MTCSFRSSYSASQRVAMKLLPPKGLAEFRDIKVVSLDENALNLARKFLEKNVIPAKAVEDAFHVAIATSQGMDFLLTWIADTLQMLKL